MSNSFNVKDLPSGGSLVDMSYFDELPAQDGKNPAVVELGLLEKLGPDGMKPLTDDDGVFRFLSPEPEPGEAADVSPSDSESGDQDDAAIQPDAEATVA